MTREEAVDYIKEWLKDEYALNNKDRIVLTMAIEALSNADCRKVRQDHISRQDAVNEIHKYFVEEIDKTPTKIDEDGDEVYTDMPTVNSLLACNKELSKRIKSLPFADRPTGEWINRERCQVDEDAYEVANCSECGAEITIDYPYDSYCPNCGAKMG